METPCLWNGCSGGPTLTLGRLCDLFQARFSHLCNGHVSVSSGSVTLEVTNNPQISWLETGNVHFSFMLHVSRGVGCGFCSTRPHSAGQTDRASRLLCGVFPGLGQIVYRFLRCLHTAAYITLAHVSLVQANHAAGPDCWGWGCGWRMTLLCDC